MPVLIHIHINIIIFEASKLHQKPPPTDKPPHLFCSVCIQQRTQKKTITTQGHSALNLATLSSLWKSACGLTCA